MTIVNVDQVTNDVTVVSEAPYTIDVTTGGGNPSMFNVVVDHLNYSGLSGSRTLPNGFTLNELAQWIIQVVEDLYTAGLFTPVTPTTFLPSSNRVYT